MKRRLYKQGKFSIEKVGALVLALAAGFIILFVIFLNDEGGVQKGNQAMENTMNTITRLSRGNTPVNKLDIPVSKDFFDTWTGLIDDIKANRERLKTATDAEKAAYCILPFDRTSLDLNYRIELLKSDEGLIVQMTYKTDESQTASERFETQKIDGMHVRLGVLRENAKGNAYFPSIDIQTKESIDIGQAISLSEDGSFSPIDSTTYAFLPAFFYGFTPEHGVTYNSVGGMSVKERRNLPVISADDLSKYPPVIFLLNYDTIVVLVADFNELNNAVTYSIAHIVSDMGGNEDDFANIMQSSDIDDDWDDLTKFNLMNAFDGSGVAGESATGYPFCFAEDESLLTPEDDTTCSCDVAKNPAMCASLGIENCGMDCRWDTDAKICTLDDASKTRTKTALKDLFTTMVTDFIADHRACYQAYPLELDTPGDNELSTLIEGIRLDFTQNELYYSGDEENAESILSNDELADLISFDGYSTDQKELIISGIDNSMLKFGSQGSYGFQKNGEENYMFSVKKVKEDDGTLELVLSPRQTIEKEDDPLFCRQDDIYLTGVVQRDDSCTDIDSMHACMLHEEDGDRCHWLNRDAVFGRGIGKIRIGCKPDDNDYPSTEFIALPDAVREKAEQMSSFLVNTDIGCYTDTSSIQTNPEQVGDKTYTLYLENIGDDVGIFFHVTRDDWEVDFLYRIVNGVNVGEGPKPIPEGSADEQGLELDDWKTGIYLLNGLTPREGYSYFFRRIEGKRYVFVSETESLQATDFAGMQACEVEAP